MSKKEITETQNSELAVQGDQLELDLKSILGDSGAGSENVTADDTKTPFIRIIQALSKQHQKAEPEYIEGAEIGMLLNNISMDVYDELIIVPIHYEKRHIEKMRKLEKVRTTEEFVADHGVSVSILNGLKQEGYAYVTEDNNLIYPTATHYVLTIDSNGISKPAVITFPSSLADQSRRLNTCIAESFYPKVDGKKLNKKPARWYESYKLGTQIKTKDNNKWYVYKITKDQPLISISDDGSISDGMVDGLSLYKEAKSFYELIQKGDVEVQDFVDEELKSEKDSDDAPF